MFSRGSPFARAIRILLDELGLTYEGQEPQVAPTERQLGSDTPTMQVPTLRDGDITLWDSGTIAEFLLTKYTHRPEDNLTLAMSAWRPDYLWNDKLLFSTIQTFGTAATTISQLTWEGVHVDGNAHLRRCRQRMILILDWLENELESGDAGFFPDCLSMQDIFLICHIRFVQARPLGVTLDLSQHKKIRSLADRMDYRKSFRSNPIWWWDPEVIGYEPDGTPIYRAEK